MLLHGDLQRGDSRFTVARSRREPIAHQARERAQRPDPSTQPRGTQGQVQRGGQRRRRRGVEEAAGWPDSDEPRVVAVARGASNQSGVRAAHRG